MRVIASNPRTPQVKGGIALTEFADAMADAEASLVTDQLQKMKLCGASD